MTTPAMMALDDFRLGDRARVGGKAAALGHLLASGLPVPEGFVVLDPEAFRVQVELGARATQELFSSGIWIARSSALVEDGGESSFAGQFRSVCGLVGCEAVLRGVQRVSRSGVRARAYVRSRGLPELEGSVPVLVQRQIEPLRAGVLFTVDPLGRTRGGFALDWTLPGETPITDGGSSGHLLVYDPLAEPLPSVSDEVMTRTLARLTELAFEATAALGEVRPLDLEWVVDGAERLWLVQARPVTGRCARPCPDLMRARAEGFYPQSKRPVSRLARRSFQDAGAVDRLAATFHPGGFERRVVGAFLMVRRVKRARRPRVEARTPLGFLARWLVLRRRNLLFGLGWLPAWGLANGPSARRAERLLRTGLDSIPTRALATIVRQCLDDFRRVRRVHAAMWYPVDLLTDLEQFAETFQAPGLLGGVRTSPRRQRREQESQALSASLRGVGGKALSFEELDSEQRERLFAHLARFPYSFQSSEEVQDLACWRSFVEEPEAYVRRLFHVREHGQAARAAMANASSPSSVERTQRLGVRLFGAAIRGAVRCFAPLKDDRVELLALSSAAVRWVCLELERRAGGDSRASGWVFELEPEELLQFARVLDDPRARDPWRALGQRRQRQRIVAELGGLGEEGPSPGGLPITSPSRATLVGEPLSGGLARGRARVLTTLDEALRLVHVGDVLIADEIRPCHGQVMARAAALICRRGSPLSHGAIVARELGIPAVAIGDQVAALPHGVELVVDGHRGQVTLVEAA